MPIGRNALLYLTTIFSIAVITTESVHALQNNPTINQEKRLVRTNNEDGLPPIPGVGMPPSPPIGREEADNKKEQGTTVTVEEVRRKMEEIDSQKENMATPPEEAMKQEEIVEKQNRELPKLPPLPSLPSTKRPELPVAASEEEAPELLMKEQEEISITEESVETTADLEEEITVEAVVPKLPDPPVLLEENEENFALPETPIVPPIPGAEIDVEDPIEVAEPEEPLIPTPPSPEEFEAQKTVAEEVQGIETAQEEEPILNFSEPDSAAGEPTFNADLFSDEPDPTEQLALEAAQEAQEIEEEKLQTAEVEAEKESTKKADKNTFKPYGIAEPRKTPSYKFSVPSERITKKWYRNVNRHLPIIKYESEYYKYFIIAAAEGNMGALKALQPYITDINFRDKNKNTSLHRSIESGEIQIARYLLAKGADPNLQNKQGKTPLHIAISINRIDLVHLLLTVGANPDLRDEEGNDSRDYAMRHNHWGLIPLLVDETFDVEAVNDQGNTRLIVAVMSGSLQEVEFLLNRGAEIEITSDEGYTPLMLAAYNGDLPIVTALIRAGADPTATDNYNRTALDLAEQAGNVHISKRLMSVLIKQQLAAQTGPANKAGTEESEDGETERLSYYPDIQPPNLGGASDATLLQALPDPQKALQ